MQSKTFAARVSRDSAGATAVEYSLIAMLIALAAIGALQTLGGSVEDTWTEVADKAAK